jgi:hypothetical protein
MAFKISANTVIDNYGNILHSTFETVAGTIQSTRVKVKASDSVANDFMGNSLSIGSGRIVAGAPGNDDLGSGAGAAYIFNLAGTQIAKIKASDGASGDEFGYAVAAGSGRIVVGAPYDDVDDTNSGSAYIFNLDGTQLAKINASDLTSSDYFGSAVAIGCGRIVVGAYGVFNNSGAIYIYSLSGTELVRVAAPNYSPNIYFGWSVTIGCGRIVVGAYGGPEGAGIAYIFDLNGILINTLYNPDAVNFGNDFGFSVAIGSGRIVIGQPGHTTFSPRGKAHIYDLNGAPITTIIPADVAVNDKFGQYVAIGSGRIAIASTEDDDNQLDSGSVYVYDLKGTQLEKINSGDFTSGLTRFGRGISIKSSRIVASEADDDVPVASGAIHIFKVPEILDTYYDEILDTYRY